MRRGQPVRRARWWSGAGAGHRPSQPVPAARLIGRLPDLVGASLDSLLTRVARLEPQRRRKPAGVSITRSPGCGTARTLDLRQYPAADNTLLRRAHRRASSASPRTGFRPSPEFTSGRRLSCLGFGAKPGDTNVGYRIRPLLRRGLSNAGGKLLQAQAKLLIQLALDSTGEEV